MSKKEARSTNQGNGVWYSTRVERSCTDLCTLVLFFCTLYTHVPQSIGQGKHNQHCYIISTNKINNTLIVQSYSRAPRVAKDKNAVWPRIRGTGHAVTTEVVGFGSLAVLRIFFLPYHSLS